MEKKQPTADCIVARLTPDWGSIVSLLFKTTEPYEHYYDEHGEEVPYGAIASWTDVELPPESDDERIRQGLLFFIKKEREKKHLTWDDIPLDVYEAYLVKQKDILRERAQNITANMLEDRIEGIQHELIEFLSNTIDASWVDIIKSADSYAERIKNIIEKQKKQPASGSSEKSNNHKEWSDNFEENIRNLLHEKLKCTSDDGSMSSAVFIDDKTLKDIISGIWFYVGKEALKYPNKQLNVGQKPNIELIQRSWYMEGYHDGKFEMEPMWILETGEGGPRYKKNERYGQSLEKKQKSAKWSKKDEKIRKTLLGYCKKAFDNYPRVEWLNGITYGELCDWLKSFLHPHWKPSREQMDCLVVAASGYRNSEVANVLNSLIDDLEKL